MALAAALVLTLSARAAETVIAVNAPAGTVRAGESFTVTVDLSGNPGFNSVQFTLAFDQEALECTAADTGGLLQGVLAASNPEADTGAIIAAASVEAVAGDGVLGEFRFTAKKDVQNPAFRLEEIILSDADGADLSYTLRQQTGGTQPSTGAGPSQTPGGRKEETPRPPAGGETAEPQRPEETPRPPAGGETAKPQQPEETPRPPAESETAKPQQPEERPGTTGEPEQRQPSAEAADPLPAETAPEKTAAQQAEAKQFSDLDGHWAAEYIRKAAARGLVSGYGDGSFRPGGQVTRGQMAVILWRLAGRPEPEGTAPFTDIAGISGEFRTAIAWGYGKGLLNGVSDTAYAPGDGLSRQAAMKLLHGYFGGQSGMESLLARTYDAAFTDSAQLSPWAKAPVYWAVYNGILTGTSRTTLSPRDGVTRAQLSVILTRALDRFEA